MKKLHIHIPLVPNEKTLSQLAFYSYSLKVFEGSKYLPSLKAFLAGPIQPALVEKWGAHLQGVEFVEKGDGELEHLDKAFFEISEDADLVAFSRSQGFFVKVPEEVLEEAEKSEGIAGVVAFAPFPSKFANPKKAWDKVFEALEIEQPAYDFNYTHRPKVKIPYYLNMGLVIASGGLMRRLASDYKYLVEKLKNHLPEPHYSYQIGLTALLAKHKAAQIALPLEYNFPNDDIPAATRDFNSEKLSFCHYLREKSYDNQAVMMSAEGFYDLLLGDLFRSDVVLQEGLKKVSGGLWPF